MHYTAHILLALLLFSFTAQSQQAFEVKYNFKANKFLKANLVKLEKKEIVAETKIGYVLINGVESSIFSKNKVKLIAPIHKGLVGNLFGRIEKRNEDSLFIKFWFIDPITDPKKGSNDYVNSEDNDKEFVYVIPKEQWKRGVSLSLPYYYRMLTATNLPFRTKLNDGKLEADFLNFNVSHLWINGRTKLYKNDFIKPRYFHFGFGPFVGLTSIDNKEEASKEFGITYGITILFSFYNLNLVGAFGLENGFSSKTNSTTPYLGIGLGFKLVDLFDPEISKKE